MPKTSELPTTAYAVLGLLTETGEISGYDLVKASEGSIGFFWSPAKSNVYAELRRLVDEGLVRGRRVAQPTRPDKRLYRITAAGERAFRSWLGSSRLEPDTARFPILLRVFFAERMGPDAFAAMIKGYRDGASTLLARFNEMEDRIGDAGEKRGYPYLTLKFGMDHMRTTMRWCDDVLRRVERGEVG